ncbi:hypothetical protein MTP99_019209 [Tenebrio molitor]|nr:hypothetical protein MTP99_019209 [Tenebrio molitor]
MALSGKLFRRINRTFRKHPRSMGDTPVWKNISMSIRRIDNPPSPEAEVHVVICGKYIMIEYVHVAGTVEKTRHIHFRYIEATLTPTVDSVTLALDGGEEVTFRFGTEASKREFIEAITIESSDSGNSEGSNLENSEGSNSENLEQVVAPL